MFITEQFCLLIFQHYSASMETHWFAIKQTQSLQKVTVYLPVIIRLMQII